MSREAHPNPVKAEIHTLLDRAFGSWRAEDTGLIVGLRALIRSDEEVTTSQKNVVTQGELRGLLDRASGRWEPEDSGFVIALRALLQCAAEDTGAGSPE